MNSNYRFTTLSGSTPTPNSTVMVLNSQDPPLKKFIKSFDRGLLNPNQAEAAVAGRSYFTIGSAYGEEPTEVYSSRSCIGGTDLGGYTPPGAGYVGYPKAGSKGIDDSSVNNFFSSTNPRIIKPTTSILRNSQLSKKLPEESGDDWDPQGVPNQMRSATLGSGKYLRRGQGLTSIGGSKFYIDESGKICIVDITGSPDCFYPSSGTGRSTVPVGYLIMHKNGSFKMTDINGKNIPLIFKHGSRPLQKPIPGSFARFQDDTSFNIHAPGGAFLYSVF